MKLDAIIDMSMERFKAKVKESCQGLDLRELTVTNVETFTRFLKDGLCEAGREALREFVESYDEEEIKLENEGNIFYWKMASEKKFLTPFGNVTIKRNLYQASNGDDCYIPLDEKWGMKGEFATLEVREAILYTLAHLTPKETQEHLKKWAWFSVSETAIKNVAKEIGHFIEYQKTSINEAVRAQEEIPEKTRALVASVDGVNVLLNEAGNKKGRPTERPKNEENNESPSSYRNAMVGAISFYGKTVEGEKTPERLESKYVARMPEAKFSKIKDMFEQELSDTEFFLPSTVEKVVLCDGSRAIWKYVDNSEFYNDYKKLVDFYHATEHLSKASEAIFGKMSGLGKLWYKKWKTKLLEDNLGVQRLLQSLRYYASGNLSTSRKKMLQTEITFFRRNKHRMRYAHFLQQELPIGSGPVEAACKTIVKNRLCRSGMRWSIAGGQRILSLRCYVKSNRWNLFWNTYKSFKHAA